MDRQEAIRKIRGYLRQTVVLVDDGMPSHLLREPISQALQSLLDLEELDPTSDKDTETQPASVDLSGVISA